MNIRKKNSTEYTKILVTTNVSYFFSDCDINIMKSIYVGKEPFWLPVRGDILHHGREIIVLNQSLARK